MNSPAPVESSDSASDVALRPQDQGQTGLVTVLRPARSFWQLDLAELWQARELFMFLAARDVKVRYKQTALGAAWALLQPLLTMLVFTLVFSRVAKIPTQDVPYPIFCFAALLPWQMFAHALTQSSNSLVTNERLITKIYFPRLLVPASSVAGALVDFGLALFLLAGLMAWYGIVPGWSVLMLPVFTLLALLTALAVGLWLSALNTMFRDFRYVLPFLTQIWLFVSPVAYPSTMVSGKWRWVYGLNPMAGVIEGFRWALVGTAPPGLMMVVSVTVTLLLLATGLFYFRRMERQFADWI